MTGYFAQVEDGIVLQVRIVTAERIAEHPDLYPGTWVEVPDMNQYPAPGYTHDSVHGFRPAQPFASWTWDVDTRAWFPPTPHPDDGLFYAWNEADLAWEQMK